MAGFFRFCGKETEMTKPKFLPKKLLAILLSLLTCLSSLPLSMLMMTQEAYADTLSVSLSRSSSSYSYGGTGLAHKYTVTVGGKTKNAYCLQPDKLSPETGTRKAAEMPDSSKVAQTMYYCCGYPGEKKLSNWLSSHGFSSYASGTNFYLFCHVLLSYAYEPDGAFVGWSGGKANTTISSSYQSMIKSAYAYVKSLPDPAGFSSEISFTGANTATWTEDLQFKSSVIKFTGHEDNYVEYTVPSDMTLHMNGKSYTGGTKLRIEGGSSFYLTTENVERADTTYTSPVLSGNLQDYTAYKITDSGKQTMAFFAVDKADTASFKVKFGPVSAKIKIVKVDKETGKKIPQAGVTFDIRDSKGNAAAEGITTDSSGTAVSERLKPGTYYIREVKAPSGYYLTADDDKVEITLKDCAAGEVSFTKEDPPQKGIITIEKLGDYINNAGEKDEELLANIKFRIIAAEDIFSGDTVTKLYSKGDIVQDNLITNTKGRVSSDKLPLGSYRVEEVGAFDRNTGQKLSDYKYKIIDGENYKDVTISAAEQTVKIIYADALQRNDGIPEIGTTAKDSATGGSEGEYSKSATIIDTVKYTKLEPGKEYTVKGKLMDADTGKVLKINGKEVTSERTFTAKTYDGSVDMEFTFDATKIFGKTVVVFEDLYRHKTKVASHADITDKGQTITYPEVKTEAHSETTESHMGERQSESVITDTVSYSNLIPGKTYTLKGILMDKETGKALEQNGRKITSEISFTPSAASGTAEMKFTVDSTLLSGKTVVVFENLYREGILVGSHADITDKDQSIYYPEIMTTAADDATKDNQGHIAEKVTITDTVKYVNLEPGREYRLRGILMDKEKNQPFISEDQIITSETVFTPDKSSGSVEMKFEVSSAELEGATTVVFEYLYTGNLELAIHADINDDGQSVHWPKIKTTALDERTGTHTGSISKLDSITDTVSYSNLVPGRTYTVKGTLMDKESGKALKVNGKEVTAEKTFTADKADGKVQLTFRLDSSSLEKKTVVVFEDLYHNDVKITSHSDLTDKDQSITYPELPDTAKTGDDANPLLYAGIALGAAAAAAAVLLIRKRRRNIAEDDITEE